MTGEDSTHEKQNSFLAGVNKALPLVQWLVTIAIGIGVLYLAQRDTQTNQSFAIQKLETGQQQIREDAKNRAESRDKQIEKLKDEMLTREVFEAYFQNIKHELEQQRRLTEKILENQHK